MAMLSLPAIEDTPSPAESVSSSPSGDPYPINDSELAKFSYTGSGARCRTAVACDKCRERKTKCSGERPVCKRCSSRGLICVYASRETKRRPAHSGVHGGTRTLVVRDEESVGSISKANSDGYSIHKAYSSRLGQFTRRPSDPFIEQHHTSPYQPSYFTQPYTPQMNHFPRGGATHAAMYSGIPYDNFVGLAERDIALMSQSRSVSHQFDPLYYMRRQSASSESSVSSLGSAPHTPTDPCHTFISPSSCPNPTAFPASYSPDSEYNLSYFGNNQTSYSLGFGGKNHSSESFHPTPSTAMTEHPDQYDHDSGFPGVDHLGSRPSPMKLGSEFGAPACNQILGGSQWHSTSPSPLSSWADPCTTTPLTTTPEEKSFDRETCVNDNDSRLAGSLLLEPVTLSLPS